MRISDKTRYDSMIKNIQKNQADLYKTQKEIASGQKVVNIADDPGLNRQIMALDDTITKVNGYVSNISKTKSELQTYESMIDGVVESVKDLQNLTIKAGNSAYYDMSKESFKKDIDNILTSLLTKANNNIAGSYAFSGSLVDTKPYTANYTDGKVTSVTYAGDNQSKIINLDNNDRIYLNLSGETIFQGQAGGSEDIFQELIDIRNDMQDDKFHNIDQHLTNLNGIIDRLVSKRGEIGNNVKHMESMESFLQNFQLNLGEKSNEMRATDMAAAIVTMTSIENVFQGSLQVAARMDKLSILNYL